MRCSLSIPRLSLLLIAGVAACTQLAPAGSPDNHDLQSWRKTVEYHHDATALRYSIEVSILDANRMGCQIVFENRSVYPAFFLKRDAADATRERKALHIVVGSPHLYHESAVPRLDLVKPGESLCVTFEVECGGSCSSLNYADVTFFFVAHDGEGFKQAFPELEGDEHMWFVRDEALWDQYYRNLETETVLFSIVPITE